MAGCRVQAACNGHLVIVTFLVEQAGAKVDTTDNFGKTPLSQVNVPTSLGDTVFQGLANRRRPIFDATHFVQMA